MYNAKVHSYCCIHCLSLDGVHSVPSAGVWGRVVKEQGAQGEDAHRSKGSCDEDREHSQGQDLRTHRLPLLLAVLDAVVQEDRTQGG